MSSAVGAALLLTPPTLPSSSSGSLKDHRAPHYGSAGARCYISYNHGLGATTGYPEHDLAKVATVLGHADRKCHRRSETDAIPGALQQSLRNLATDLYNSGHGVPSLFLAAIKSGPHPAKGRTVPSRLRQSYWRRLQQLRSTEEQGSVNPRVQGLRVIPESTHLVGSRV